MFLGELGVALANHEESVAALFFFLIGVSDVWVKEGDVRGMA